MILAKLLFRNLSESYKIWIFKISLKNGFLVENICVFNWFSKRSFQMEKFSNGSIETFIGKPISASNSFSTQV